MPFLPGSDESLVLDKERESLTGIKASMHYKAKTPALRPRWLRIGKPSNVTCYEIKYNILKKNIPEMIGQNTKTLDTSLINFIASTLSIFFRKLDDYVPDKERDFTTLIETLFEYEETNDLSNIDGYIATTGIRTRIVLRLTLTPRQKKKAIQELLRRVEHKQEPGIYLWKDE